MGKAARNRHNEARRGAQKRSAHNMQAAKLNYENIVEEKSGRTKKEPSPAAKKHDAAAT